VLLPSGKVELMSQQSPIRESMLSALLYSGLAGAAPARQRGSHDSLAALVGQQARK
jgi:hypothetical protein